MSLKKGEGYESMKACTHGWHGLGECPECLKEPNREPLPLLDSIHGLQVDFDKKAKELGRMSSLATDEPEQKRLMTKAGCYRACANDIRRIVRDTSND